MKKLSTNLATAYIYVTEGVHKGASLTKGRIVQIVTAICYFHTPRVSVFKLRTLKPQL